MQLVEILSHSNKIKTVIIIQLLITWMNFIKIIKFGIRIIIKT